MNKLVKNRMVIISISLALLVLINIAVSYSYYLGKVVGNETSTTLSFTSAGVIIEYENNSGSITDTNIIPGWSTTKNFTVKSTMKENEGNNNDSKLGYAVKMIVDNNDFPDNSIAYSIAQNGSVIGNGQAMEAATDVGIATGANSEGIILGTGCFVVGNNEHNYTLTIKYMASQTVDGNKNFGIHLIVETVKAATVTVDLNGGTYTGSTTKYIPLGIATTIEEPTKEGYTFTGWKITSGEGTVTGNIIISSSLELTVQAQYESNIPPFETDSWATIASNIKSGNTSRYKVGETKEVAVEGFTNTSSKRTFTVRIANNSNYDCTLASKTACGFVVEFVDIVAERAMNSKATNVGGWPKTTMRTYLNGDFKAKLPSDLQNVIIDTTVVSGHGSTSGETNFTSTDKIYLLSAREVWVDGTSNAVSNKDTAYSNTRQLDYYEQKGVTADSYSNAIKNYGGVAFVWWLRTATSYVSDGFNIVSGDGKWGDINADYTGTYFSIGIAPAFRIG